MCSVWDPWNELASRRHIVLAFDPIAKLGGGGVYARRGRRAAIVLDPELSRRDRRAALAHELVHDERGGVVDAPDSPPLWAAVVAREEQRVDKIVATRLVPAAALHAWLARRVTVGAVSCDEVAEEFDVPDRVAALALTLLATPCSAPAAAC
jgi:hypothetical protein